jgi:phosphoglycerate dehydrogenase-like enzyme
MAVGVTGRQDQPVVVALGTVDQALLGRAPRLQVLARTGVGTDLAGVVNCADLGDLAARSDVITAGHPRTKEIPV